MYKSFYKILPPGDVAGIGHSLSNSLQLCHAKTNEYIYMTEVTAKMAGLVILTMSFVSSVFKCAHFANLL